MKHLRTFVLLMIAFVAGAFASRLPETARAAAAPVAATSIDLNALSAADFPPPNPALPNLRTKALAQVDSTLFSYSVGTAPKHTHANTTEVQLILGGTGTEWLGDKEIAIGPGTLVIIPPNTVHGGLTGGPFESTRSKRHRRIPPTTTWCHKTLPTFWRPGRFCSTLLTA